MRVVVLRIEKLGISLKFGLSESGIYGFACLVESSRFSERSCKSCQ